MDPTAPLNDIMAAIRTHNWLGLVMILALCLRTYFSSKSSFPKTLNPNWQPVFVGVATAIITTDAALQNKATVLVAVLSGTSGFVAGGFLDGLAVAIFGSAAAAPTWAKWLLQIVDSAVGLGGSASGGGTLSTGSTDSAAQDRWTKPPPSNANRSRMAPGFAVALLVGAMVFAPRPVARDIERTSVVLVGEGCAWWQANNQNVVRDLSAVGSCVLSQVFQGVTKPLDLTKACAPATLEDVEQVLSSLLNFYTQSGAAGAGGGQRCGQGEPPVKSAPVCVTVEQYLQLETAHAASGDAGAP